MPTRPAYLSWFSAIYRVCDSQSTEATTATVLYGYKLLQRQNDSSTNAEDDWQFALVRGQRVIFYVRTDSSQQLDRYVQLSYDRL